jgi:hypothetical protein
MPPSPASRGGPIAQQRNRQSGGEIRDKDAELGVQDRFSDRARELARALISPGP